MKNRVIKVLLTMAMVVGLMPGMSLTVYAADFSTLQEGDVLHVGDTINSTTEYQCEGGYLPPSLGPYTLVRADVSRSDDGPPYKKAVTESDTGAYYLLKFNNDYVGADITNPVSGDLQCYWPATATSDGISVTSVGSGVYPPVTFAVHEPSHTHNEIVFTSWTSTNSLPPNAGNYYLNNDVTLSDAWTVPTGITNLCLNGHTIKYNGSKDDANIIDVNSGATLNLYDEEDNNGKIQGLECKKSGNYGSVNVNGGSFTMHGGTIQGPGRSYKTGGGVFVGSSGNVTISGGTITGYSNGVVTSNTSSHKNSITVTGGNIADNGTGIAFSDGESLTITGGRITGNYNGVRLTNPYANFSISGSPYIYENINFENKKSNLYFVNVTNVEMRINITGELSENTKIGVKSNKYPIIFTNGWKANMSDKDPTNYFSSDDSTYTVKVEGNELKLGLPHTHIFKYTSNGATITAECTAANCDLSGSKATLTIAAAGGTYDGTTSFGATITDAKSIQGEAKVQYQKKNGETYGVATETAPINAGDYKASITLGSGNNTATASVEYTIEKADPNPSSNLTGSAKYGQKRQDISLNMPFDSTPGDWSWVDPDASVGSIGEHTFNINFTPDDAANYKSLSNVPVTVTVGKADNPATVIPTASVKKGGVELDLAGNVSLNGATGTVSYEFRYDDHKGCTLNGSKLISGNVTDNVDILVSVGADDIYKALDTKLITVTITEKDPQTITAQDVTATYGDTDKSVSATVTVPETGGGAISYAVKSGSEEYIGIDSSTGVLTIKKVPADGKAYVTVTAAETATYAETTKEVTVTISKATPLANNFTYTAPSDLVYDGTAKSATVVKADGVTGMGTVTVKYYSDAACKTEAEPINAVTYYVGITVAQGDNYNATASVLHGDSWTFTIGKADPTPATVTANNRTYDGTDKPLVTVSGEPTGGTMEYGISSTEEAPGLYINEIPTATYAGTYYVWYKVIGDDNHNNTEPEKLTVTVAKAGSKVKTAPAANDLTYTGDPQPLITAGTAEGGTMKYSTDGTNYSAAIPAGTDAGPYTVYYMVEGDEDHKDTDPQTLEVNIKKADPTPLLPEGFIVNAEPGDTLAANESQLPEGWVWVDGTTGVGNDDGTFTFPANYTGSSNYDPEKQVPVTVNVSKAYYEYVTGSSSGVWTKGSSGTLLSIFRRTQKDKQKTFDSFLSASCDGNPMTKDDQYTIEQGSLKIYLNDSMLNKLSVGTHTLLVAFSDGEATTTFKVVEKSSGGDSSRDYNPPKTGIE